MTEAVARALIDKYWTAFENNDLEGWLSCYADDATYEDYAVSFFASDKTGIRDFITQYFDGVTDGEVTLHEANVWDNGSRYLLEWTIKETSRARSVPRPRTTWARSVNRSSCVGSRWDTSGTGCSSPTATTT